MDLISILATVILATTIATVIMGFVAYAAFKLREKRRPNVPTTRDMPLDDGGEPIFFSRYLPSEMEMQADRDGRDF